jgi:hypothetical protein
LSLLHLLRDVDGVVTFERLLEVSYAVAKSVPEPGNPVRAEDEYQHDENDEELR